MRKSIVILVTLIIVVIFAYSYIYQDHRDVKSEVAEFEVTTNTITSSFVTNSKKAEAKYLNATIEVLGTIIEITNVTITVDDKVFCQFTNTLEKTFQKKSQIKIKRRLIGYDDLLEQVKLDQYIIN